MGGDILFAVNYLYSAGVRVNDGVICGLQKEVQF
jgi:hypothetical protein